MGDVDIEISGVAGIESFPAQCSHGGIVGAEFRRGDPQVDVFLFTQFREGDAERLVGRDSAPDQEL